MTTIIINDKTKQAKAIIEMLRAFSFVKIEDENAESKKLEKKIKQSEKQIKEGKFKELDSKDVWASLGL